MNENQKYDGLIALNIVVMFVCIISIIWLFSSCSPIVNAELEKVAVEVIDDIPELIHEETGIETPKTNP
jgi:hypothetical protein